MCTDFTAPARFVVEVSICVLAELQRNQRQRPNRIREGYRSRAVDAIADVRSEKPGRGIAAGNKNRNRSFDTRASAQLNTEWTWAGAPKKLGSRSRSALRGLIAGTRTRAITPQLRRGAPRCTPGTSCEELWNTRIYKHSRICAMRSWDYWACDAHPVSPDADGRRFRKIRPAVDVDRLSSCSRSPGRNTETAPHAQFRPPFGLGPAVSIREIPPADLSRLRSTSVPVPRQIFRHHRSVTGPGHIAFTRTPFRAASAAFTRVNPSIPAFAAAYAEPHPYAAFAEMPKYSESRHFFVHTS